MTKKSKTKQKNPLFVHILLDRSGSMQSCRSNAIEAFNEYVTQLKSDKTKGKISLTIFDGTSFDKIRDKQNIKKVKKLDQEEFQPRGMTPLYDAIAHTIADIKANATIDSRVALTILTDGYENASVENTEKTNRKLIKECQKKDWLVTYLGANQDAIQVGLGLGIGYGNSMTYTTDNFKGLMQSSARSTSALACATVNSSGKLDLAETEFTDEERKGAVTGKKSTSTLSEGGTGAVGTS